MTKKPQALPSKEEIQQHANQGAFNQNPLLATPHEVVCASCKRTWKIIFLECLKTGHFELGKTEMLEVTYAAPTMTGLNRTAEPTTPLLIAAPCPECGLNNTFRPMSLEYLLYTVARRTSQGFYV